MLLLQGKPGARLASILAAAALLAAGLLPARAADPIKVDFSAELTGSLAAIGKQTLLTEQIWAEDVNNAGGLLGRKVELVYYDDQSNPALVPSIYEKLLDVDHVDLVVAQGTNISTPAMPTIMEHNKVVMVMLALAINEKFHYQRFFQTMPYGPDGKDALTRGFFEAAMSMNPKPKTVAIVGADAEFSKAALDGARNQIKRFGLKTVYDRTYPPNTIDYTPIVNSIAATNPDVIMVASYPADTSGILRAAQEVGLKAKIFGGPMVGLQAGPIKMQLGPALNGIVCYELFVHEPTMHFPGTDEFIKKYQARAGEAGVDPLGYYVPPFTYATMQVLQDAVTAVGSLDQDKIADYIHKTSFQTVVGDIKFGPDGEWATPRILTIQYQNIKGHGMEQFTEPGHQVILYPRDLKSGTLQYPYSDIKH
ncbi:MAG TPA: amino acid ABC transporter substrate-binding protein [Stellaceae bacterium]|nr:amino acid ABC transporter substrate-binding protein [Stellaceae bacterium]